MNLSRLLTFGVLAVASIATAAGKPNFIIIVGDDLGYGDTGTFGSPDIPTPNLQALADRGTKFTNAYVTAPVCAPSRAGLMSCRFPQRFGFYENIPDESSAPFGLPTNQWTLAERLKRAGYTTGLVGKWHLGDIESYRPNVRGFDSFYGFLKGGSGYYPGGVRTHQMYRNNIPTTFSGYLTWTFRDEAVNFIAENRAKPFFLVVSPNAVHSPHDVPTPFLALYPQLTGERRKVAAMVTTLDLVIGDVRAAVDRAGLTEKTVIVFLSDNGGVLKNGASSNAPFTSGKSTLKEGGIHVPMVMSMPGTIPQGRSFSRVMSSMDIGPTFLAMAGAPIAPNQVDGVNLLPYLANIRKDAPHPYLYWAYQQSAAVRHGDYKLLITDLAKRDTSTKLFDLSTDVGETTDLRLTRKGLVASLLSKFDEWNSQNIPPLW